MSSSGKDAQPQLAARAEVRAFWVVKVAGVGMEGDDRAGSQLQSGDVPLVVDLLMLDRPSGPALGIEEREDDLLHGRLGVAAGHFVEEPGGLDAA